MNTPAILMLTVAATTLIACKAQEPAPVMNTAIEQKATADAKILELKVAKIQEPEVKPAVVTVKPTSQVFIENDGILGFKIGATIDVESKNLKKSVQENGEGDFEGYLLLDNSGEEIGFVFADHKHKNIIKMIEINSPKYTTKEGITIGTTYQEFKAMYPHSIAHGSEIEGRTHSQVGNILYQWDVYFGHYNIDQSKIKPSAKIIRMMIQG
ncbi:hypothetical protein [Marinagarivorans algicola]|uniref:hypothetical protein n=1 Tax=Marinagarivorans algicola TaxID=1513270 RepID=UPI0006B4AD83|nr:hypothetical protein [Marinagarivorans algicola]